MKEMESTGMKLFPVGQRYADALKIARDNLDDVANSPGSRFSQRWAHMVFRDAPRLALVEQSRLDQQEAELKEAREIIADLLESLCTGDVNDVHARARSFLARHTDTEGRS